MKRLVLFLLILLFAVLTGIYSTTSGSQISFGTFSFYEPKNLVPEIEVPLQKDKIRFVGDIMLARSVEKVMHQYGYEYPFAQLQALPKTSYLVGNFEAAIPVVHVPTQSMEFSFSVLPEFTKGLTQYGFTHLSLANNHAYDFGGDDFEHTVNVLQNAPTIPFGNPHSFSSSTVPLVTVGSSTVALIGVHAVNTVVDVAEVQDVIVQASSVSDIQIIYIHWGEEYESIHNSYQENLAHAFIDTGADVIVGHHPHVVQDIELYKNGVVFYSLGNFIFDQYFSKEVQEGLTIELQPADKTLEFELLPVTSIGSKSSPRYMTAYERDTFLLELSENSDTELREMIKNGHISVGR